jgi:FKBP-type peptidyl-prolyl cis-trans isomerase FklB
MKSTSRLLIPALVLGLNATAYAAEPTLETDKEQVSYVVGYQVGSQLKQQGFEIDIQALGLAVQDAMSGAEPRLSQEQAAEVMGRQQQKQAEQQEQIGQKNVEQGKAFLAANKEKPGVTTLDNGLQYKVITAGSGKSPQETDSVTVHYRGTLIDGTEFDSSYSRGEPTTFPVNRVIPGWTQALQLMEEGAKWQVFIPSELAYGPRGAGAQIGPNATLVFDIELIKVN